MAPITNCHRLTLCLIVSALLSCAGTISAAQEVLGASGAINRKPVGLRLTGQIVQGKLLLTDQAVRGEHHSQFEIVMEGQDYYFCKEWSGNQSFDALRNRESEGGWHVSLVVGDFGGGRGESWSRDYGGRGGAGFGLSGKFDGRVARRLWRGDEFRGIAPDELRAAVEHGHYTEEFHVSITQENFLVPSAIKWTDNGSPMPQRSRFYLIDTVEFRYESDKQFFVKAREEYFPDYDPNALALLLNSAGDSTIAQATAAASLQMTVQNRVQAAVLLRHALPRFPFKQPLGAYDQSVLLSALWRMRAATNEELVEWFYRAPRRNADHGDLDHGPLCLLRELDATMSPNIDSVLISLISDSRFARTDRSTIVQMMEMAREAFPIPKSVEWDGDWEQLPKPVVQRQLLPLWRNMLRRHFALPEIADN